MRVNLASLADGLQEREGEHLDLGRAAWAGSGDDALAARRKIDETGGDAHPGPVLTVRFEARKDRWYDARRRRQLGLIYLHFTRDAGRRSYDDVVGGRPVDLRSSYADTATRGRLECVKARQLRSERPSATYGCPGVGHNFRRAARPRADDQVKNAVTVNIPHRYIDVAFKTGKRDDGGDEPVAVAVVETNLGRFARGAWNGDRINGGGRYDVNERHQPVVFVIEAMAMHHVKPGVFVEPGADRKDAGLDHALVTVHGRCRRVGIVDGKLVGAGAQTRRRIEVLDHLKVIDVDMDRMLVVVVVDEPPLLDRVEPRLDQRHVRECAAVESIHERFRVLGARQIVEKSTGYQDLPLDVRRGVSEVDKGRVATERLTFDEGGRYAASFRGGGSRQHLGWKDEEPVGIADRGGQDAQAPQHGWRIIRSIVGVEHAGLSDRLCAASALWHLENESALGRYRHCNREPARRWNEQPGAVVGRRIVDAGIGVSILANDGDRRMPPRCGFRELDVHVGKVAHIREHPDLGLSGLALDDRLKLAVDCELHIPLVIRQRWIRQHIALGFAIRRDEVLQIAGDELEGSATIVD